MRMHRFLMVGLLVSSMPISGCATSTASSKVARAGFLVPEAAARPCRLPILPPQPTLADLELGYVERGAAILECDLSRQLAVDTLGDVARLPEAFSRN